MRESPKEWTRPLLYEYPFIKNQDAMIDFMSLASLDQGVADKIYCLSLPVLSALTPFDDKLSKFFSCLSNLGHIIGADNHIAADEFKALVNASGRTLKTLSRLVVHGLDPFQLSDAFSCLVSLTHFDVQFRDFSAHSDKQLADRVKSQAPEYVQIQITHSSSITDPNASGVTPCSQRGSL